MIDPRARAADLAALVRVPSLTGAERPAVELLATMARRLGLDAEIREHDLRALRAHPGHPGEEAPREELLTAVITLPGPGRRLCLDGHLDVVGAGERPWSFDPFAGDIVDGQVRGRGAADMKAGVVAALHAMAAARGRTEAEVVLYAVSSEEDGGLGTFAALEGDDRFDAALIPEPTGFDVVCAQAGALTFAGEIPGTAAHAALRLQGVSAIDRYLSVHVALHAHEARINAEVAHPLMRELELPYPVSVGRLEAGQWSSSVPDRVRFEGRVGVRLGESAEEGRAALAAAIRLVCPDAVLRWTGGQFEPGETPQDADLPRLVAECIRDATGRPPRFTGVSYGADMRLFCARGIPCVMAGTPGIELAHAPDERVALDDAVKLARAIESLIVRF